MTSCQMARHWSTDWTSATRLRSGPAGDGDLGVPGTDARHVLADPCRSVDHMLYAGARSRVCHVPSLPNLRLHAAGCRVLDVEDPVRAVESASQGRHVLRVHAVQLCPARAKGL